MNLIIKILLFLTIIIAIVVLAYSLSMAIDYLVTEKYHVQGDEVEKIIYTVEERAKEIKLLKRYFSSVALFSLVVIALSVTALIKKSSL